MGPPDGCGRRHTGCRIRSAPILGLTEAGILHWLPDVRHPLIAPRRVRGFHNIFAPSVIAVEDGWKIFYGGCKGIGERVEASSLRRAVSPTACRSA